jgi:hypothetical protein
MLVTAYENVGLHNPEDHSFQMYAAVGTLDSIMYKIKYLFLCDSANPAVLMKEDECLMEVKNHIRRGTDVFTDRLFFFCIFRDEDMQSLASLMSVNNNDIAPLDDFDDDEDGEGKYHCLTIN